MYSVPNIPDLLSRAIYADLCTLLPPPPDDTPEARACRDERAMTAVAHLLPENAAEAEVAVLVVAAQSRAREALRAASQPGLEPDQTRRCTAQAASMMRQADGSIRTLLRMQAERQKAETAMRPAAMERAGYWFRSVSVADPARIPGLDPGTRPAAERTAATCGTSKTRIRRHDAGRAIRYPLPRTRRHYRRRRRPARAPYLPTARPRGDHRTPHRQQPADPRAPPGACARTVACHRT